MTEQSSSSVAGPRLLVIHNPTAGFGRGRRFDRTLRRLADLGCPIEVRRTAVRGDAEALARAAAAEGCGRVVAAGGDGTINEVVNGVAGSDRPLALLPLGTANVLAAEIGLDLDPDALARTIVDGAPRPICLGRIRGADGEVRLFSLMAGVGFDAHAVAGVSAGLKRLVGKGAYVVESLRQLVAFPFPTYRVTVDGAAYEAASVVVANGHYYGGRYSCAPDARLDKPKLHVCLFERRGALAALRYALALLRGRLDALSDYRIVTATRVRVEGPPGDPVQADGDIVAALPVEIEVVPAALRLVMPSADGGRG